MKTRSMIPWFLCLLLAVAPQLQAHHSFAGYDMTKTNHAPATIKEFRWGAPHSTAVFVITGPGGEQQQITIASASPSAFVKQGFKPKDFKAGDKVELSWHPTRGGQPGGFMAGIKFADGRVFKDSEVSPGLKEVQQQVEGAK